MSRWSKEVLVSALRESTTSSTELEVRAICIAIVSLAREGSKVEIYSDSQAAVQTLEKRYSRASDNIQSLMIALDAWCNERGVDVAFRHIGRSDPRIVIVDMLSKGMVVLFEMFTV